MAAKITAALVAAQKAAKPVEHDAKNTHHGYRYSSAEAIYSEARAVLAANGLALVPLSARIETRGEGEAVLDLLVREYLLAHESGETLTLSQQWPIIPEKGRPMDKATAGADTTSLAYFVRDLLMLPRVEEGDDMDHNSRSGEPAPRREPRPDPLRQARADAKVLLVKLGIESEAAQLKEMSTVIGRNDFNVKPPTLPELRAAITSLEARLDKRARKETSA